MSFVVVTGAGPAGLPTARHFTESGMPRMAESLLSAVERTGADCLMLGNTYGAVA